MDKINILIFEDNLEEIEILKQALSDNYNICGIATNYDDGVKTFNENLPDIAILDIFIDQARDGIRFADYINHHHPIPILFLTNSKDKISFIAAKKQKPYSYLLKPVNPFEIRFAIELAIEKYVDQIGQLTTKDEATLQIDNTLLIKKGNVLVKVAIDDIYYVESDDKYCYIYTNDARFLVQKSLKSFSETLPQNFVSIHRKYVVNTNQILSVHTNDYTVILKNNKDIPVSQRHRKVLLELFTIIK
ncbi:response regulator transcription factor [Kordia sp. YSTF-M3]|uniref:Response regulator transcription factor n=1 Tax=Kordia aestuariivivens TaxID=2759037 RepID=A0ABR7QD38_9FLAO|nr:response regulator transcription factor [Kordia aestuariivivens]MBC8756476.1 response regulator transcription factor [Kordia aestuariivivens]